jgi:predicted phosphodiesterase
MSNPGRRPTAPQLSGPERHIGIIGDLHCDHKSTTDAIDRLKGLDYETIVCCGDIMDPKGNLDDLDKTHR